MKTALQSLASLTRTSITCRMHSPGWNRNHKSFGIGPSIIFGKLVNHNQYNIPNTAISIIVAKSGHHCFEIADVDERIDPAPVRKTKDNIIKKLKNHEIFTPIENSGNTLYS